MTNKIQKWSNSRNEDTGETQQDAKYCLVILTGVLKPTMYAETPIETTQRNSNENKQNLLHWISGFFNMLFGFVFFYIRRLEEQ